MINVNDKYFSIKVTYHTAMSLIPTNPLLLLKVKHKFAANILVSQKHMFDNHKDNNLSIMSL